MQVQIFKKSVEKLGDKVIKLDLMAVVADGEGKPVANQNVQFKLDDTIIAQAVTDESGEAVTGPTLVELPEKHGTLILAIPEGFAVRGSIDVPEISKEKISTVTSSKPTQTTVQPKYDKPQGIEPNKVKPIYYLLDGFFGVLIFVSGFSILGSMFRLGMTPDHFFTLVGLGYFIGWAGFGVAIGILLYRLWDSIQVPGVSTSSAMAVGLFFIPFFNCYWVFIAFYKLTQEYNRLLKEHGIDAPEAPENLALITCILFCLNYLFLGLLTIPMVILIRHFFIQFRKTAEVVHGQV